jgi:RimJ/RimL family protein N-acetyltransferase
MNMTNPNGVFELGINIGDRRYWNQGLGKEVIRLLLRHGFDHLGANEIELTTNGKNRRALRCFEATGFKERNRVPGRIPYEDERVDMVEMSIDAETWRTAVEGS